MKLLILHGPNLNMLGQRPDEHYGNESQDDLLEMLKKRFPDCDIQLFQSNYEGELVDRIQQAVHEFFDGIIVNFGGLTHSSVSLRDALELLEQEKIEVHLSNIHARESFRHVSLTAGRCRGLISGFGFFGYIMAVQAFRYRNAPAAPPVAVPAGDQALTNPPADETTKLPEDEVLSESPADGPAQPPQDQTLTGSPADESTKLPEDEELSGSPADGSAQSPEDQNVKNSPGQRP